MRTKVLSFALLLAAGCAADNGTDKSIEGSLAGSESALIETTYRLHEGLEFTDEGIDKLERLIEPDQKLAVYLDDEPVLVNSVNWHERLLQEPGPFQLVALSEDGPSTLNAELAITFDHEELLESEVQPLADVEAEYGCTHGYYYYYCNGCMCTKYICNPWCIGYTGGRTSRYHCVYGSLYKVSGGYCTTGCPGNRYCGYI